VNTLLPDWRMVAFRGVVAIAFGVLTLVWPSLTLWALVVLFGAYALVDGAVVLVGALASHLPISGGRRAWLALDGIVGIGVGVITFAWPDVTALALLFLIAAWAIVTGVMEIAGAIELRHTIDNEWLLGLAGVASVVFGILLLVTPGDGALVITWLIGWYALFFGVTVVSLAFRLRRLQTDAHDAATPFGHATA
jgi:uncharacterized membrane protein HdeD (DUF308 family)